MSKKTDNANLKAKLDLRRHFLTKYHADGDIRVFDCCQGSGIIWRTLRQEFDVRSYWGVDVKAKAGRLAVDSKRILAQTGWTENAIDIDTYGSPWKHWAAMLPHVSWPTTVFMTIGMVTPGGSQMCREFRSALGLGDLRISPAFTARLGKLATSYLLTRCCDYALIIKEAVETVSQGHARYVGVRLEPKGPEDAVTSPGPTQPKLQRSNGHV